MKKSFLVYLKNTTASSFLMRTTQNQACYRLKNQFRKQKSDLNRTRTTFQIWHDLAPSEDTTPARTRKLEKALGIIFSSFVSTNNSIQICGVKNDKRFDNDATMKLNIIQFHNLFEFTNWDAPKPYQESTRYTQTEEVFFYYSLLLGTGNIYSCYRIYVI